jgi:dTMP kinase
VRRANEMATGGVSPDLYLVLDLPVEAGLERKGGVGGGDRIEREGASFLSRVREGYRTLVKEVPTARLVAAHGGPAEVQDSIRRALEENFPETFSVKGFSKRGTGSRSP